MKDFTDLNQYMDYFESLATHNSQLLHSADNPAFAMVDFFEEKVSAKPKNDLFLMLEYPESAETGVADGELEAFTCAFAILQKPETQSFSARHQSFIATKALAKIIIGRMLYDFKKGTIEFEYDTVKYNIVSFQDNHIGWRVEFVVNAPSKLVCNPDHWTDLD